MKTKILGITLALFCASIFTSFSQTKEVYGHASDGTPLTWTPHLPSGSGPWPSLLVIHGGCWKIQEPINSQVFADLVNAGFACFAVDYRLAPPGKIPGQVGDGRYPEQTDDLELAASVLKADKRCNGRIGAVGGSAGAYHACWLTAKGLVLGGVALSPATDLVTMVAQDGFAGGCATNYVGTNTQTLAAASPLTYLHKGVSTDVLLVAFVSDDMPAAQYNNYNAGLAMDVIPHSSVLLPGAGHSWAAWPSVSSLAIQILKADLAQPTPTPSPSPTPTPTATPTTTPSPTPTPTPAAPVRRSGLVDLYAKGDLALNKMAHLPGWSNPAMVGLRFRSFIDIYEPTQGSFDHSSFDQAVSFGILNNKILGFSVNCSVPNAWQLAAGAKTITLSTGNVLLPWDPVGLQQQIAVIKDLGARYDGKIAYVEVAVGGYGLGTGLAKTQADVDACNAAGGLAAWGAAYDQYMSAACTAFSHTWTILVVNAPPYPVLGKDTSGPDALQALVNRTKAKFPNFSVENTALFSTSTSTSGLPMKLVNQLAPTTTAGLQFATSVPSFNSLHLCPIDSDVEACAMGAIEAGIKIFAPPSATAGRGLIEVYAVNADDPTLQPMLLLEAAKLQ